MIYKRLRFGDIRSGVKGESHLTLQNLVLLKLRLKCAYCTITYNY